MAGLELRNVTKSFGNNQVVRGIDLEANEGEFVVLVGASGCGKSTVLRMIAGLESASSGQILIKGNDVTHARPDERNIAMVFQSYALYPHMSVAENMSFALTLTKTPKVKINERVLEAAKILGIEELLDRKPKQLSGGQRQRVAMGRAIVREPAVFLFDEPLSNLDAKLRAQMRVELALLHKRLGKTTVYVTHDQVEAMTLADRIVILDKGVIQQIGTPTEVFNHPRNQFVAGFIGSPVMNMFKGISSSSQGITLNGMNKPIHLSSPIKAAIGTPIVLGIRPQGLTPCDATEEVLCMQVKVAEYLGTETVLNGTLAGSNETMTVVLSGDHTRLASESLSLKINPEYLHVFDQLSEMNLLH